MTERPILFSGPMVRAILDGRKTQTRRLVRAPKLPADVAFKPCAFGAFWGVPLIGDEWATNAYVPIRCPYGVPGDRLWVKHSGNVFPVYFRPIHGWEDLYAAGTDGRIYRMDRGEPEPLNGSPSSKGYLTVSLSRGQWVTRAVHKLVCETFYGPAPFDGAVVRHMDGDQTNNRPDNLDWGSTADNWVDRKAHGRGMGAQHHSSKLTRDAVEAIRASSLSQRALAAQYGVSQSTIHAARQGETWGDHKPGERNTPALRLWKSARYMPRWASRITLEVIGVRVERLQDISEDDAAAEGVVPHDHFPPGYLNGKGLDTTTHRGFFADVWDVINARRAPWASNPFVWVVGFKRMDKESA